MYTVVLAISAVTRFCSWGNSGSKTRCMSFAFYRKRLAPRWGDVRKCIPENNIYIYLDVVISRVMKRITSKQGNKTTGRRSLPCVLITLCQSLGESLHFSTPQVIPGERTSISSTDYHQVRSISHTDPFNVYPSIRPFYLIWLGDVFPEHHTDTDHSLYLH